MGGCIESDKIWDDYDVTSNLLFPVQIPRALAVGITLAYISKFCGDLLDLFLEEKNSVLDMIWKIGSNKSSTTKYCM